MTLKLISGGAIVLMLAPLALGSVVSAEREGYLRTGTGPGLAEWDGNFDFVDIPPDMLESFLEEKYPTSRMIGTMDALVSACEENNLNPALFMGISFAESTLATAQCPAVWSNNAFGYCWNPSYGMERSFVSFEASYPEIAHFVRYDIYERGWNDLYALCGYYKEGITSSPEDARKWCMDYMAQAVDLTWPERVKMCADAIYSYCAEALGIEVVIVDGMSFPCGGACYFKNDWHAPRTGHLHQGNDIFAAMGTPALAICDGTITFVGVGRNAGKYLRLTRNDGSGDFFYYMHMESIEVVVGDEVKAGQVIATVGDSGNARGGPAHIHFEYHPGGGEAQNPFYMLKALVEKGGLAYVSVQE